VRHDLTLVHMSQFVELAIAQFPAFVTNFDATIGIVDNADALSGEALVLRCGIDEIQYLVVLHQQPHCSAPALAAARR
jgi:hypothetical protein